MAIEQWVNGTVKNGYASVFGTEINSLGIGYSVLSSVAVNNSSSPADAFGQISVNLGSITTPSTPNLNLQFFLYPLNADGTTYGDGVSSWSPGQPSSAYQIDAVIPLISNVTQAQEGSTPVFTIPFQLVQFKLVVFNNSGVALASSGNTIYLRTLNRQVA